ncbi:MAG: L-histidine N(alpha)-methyltransferase [Pseudomonadota bacterium]
MDGIAAADERNATAAALLADALAGLSAQPKALRPKWLYDREGSELFERITTLPEYHLTRVEAAILRDDADSLAGCVPPGGALVELGSGASVKTRTLLNAGGHLGAYVPIDISAEFLHATADDLRERYPGLIIHPVVGDFTGPVDLPDAVRAMPKVGFFPGSTIGNLGAEAARELLSRAAGWPGVTGFILGVDMIGDPARMVAAYDDSQGVTAAFIGNILARLNRDVGADFDLDDFAYDARWNAAAAQIEMRLVSRRDQAVTLGGTVVEFARDEPIHVSTSRKYTAESLAELARESGWTVDAMSTDRDGRFAVATLGPA